MLVSGNYPIRLAGRVDTRQIAILSRDLIEAGLVLDPGTRGPQYQ